MTKKIALDVGHGLSNRSPGVYDPGAVALGRKENVIVEGMCSRLKADLQALGHQVLLTQGALTARDDTALKWGANLLVSIHCNAGGGTGTEVYIDSRASALGKKVAGYAASSIASAIGRPNRGVKVKDFAVLRANPNDCLIEMFFIDSKADLDAYMKNVDKVELCILNAILLGFGLPAQSALPRVQAEGEYIEVRVHAAKSDELAYRSLADSLNDFIVVSPSDKDAWKGW